MIVRSGKQEGSNTLHKTHFLGMNDNFWDRVRGLSSETGKGCERFVWCFCST